MRGSDESLVGTFQMMLDGWDERQQRLDETLRQLIALSTHPLTRRNFMRRILTGSKFGEDEEPPPKQFQEAPRKSRNQMTREQICFTCHAAWKLGHTCGENIGKGVSPPWDVKDTEVNVADCKEELTIAKDSDQQVEDIVEESMVGTATHEDNRLEHGEHVDLLEHDERHDFEIPFWESPLKARDMGTKLADDSGSREKDRLRKDLLAMKEEIKGLKDTIMQHIT